MWLFMRPIGRTLSFSPQQKVQLLTSKLCPQQDQCRCHRPHTCAAGVFTCSQAGAAGRLAPSRRLRLCRRAQRCACCRLLLLLGGGLGGWWAVQGACRGCGGCGLGLRPRLLYHCQHQVAELGGQLLRVVGEEFVSAMGEGIGVWAWGGCEPWRWGERTCI